jgi:hypothetical protein
MTERTIQPSEFNQTQINILAFSAIRALVRKGIISPEEITTEMMQQGVPAEWAMLLTKYIGQMPVGDNSSL